MQYELVDGLRELKEHLRKNKLAIFAGSGISKDSGIPIWDDLLRNYMEMANNLPIFNKKHKDELDQIINDAKKSISDNRFEPIKVATVLKNKLKECNLPEYPLAYSQYQIWVSSTFISNKSPNENHKLIVETNYPFILTSNYDLLFEQSAVNNGYVILSQNTYTFKNELKIMSAIHNSIPCVIHVHGSAHELSIDEIIFTKEDYNKLILKKYSGFSFALRMIFTRYSVLFVGYGASDPHLEEVMEEISEYFPLGSDPTYGLPYSYLVTLRDKSDSILERWKGRLRTHLIIIDDFDDYKKLLRELKNANPR